MRGDIRSWDAALESRVNWGWLDGCFGLTRISPSDLDFIVERNGHLLIGEIKPEKSWFQWASQTDKDQWRLGS